MPERAAGLSVRVKLTLSYAGFLVIAGIALFAVGFLLLRFVPEGNLQLEGGGWAPNRTNLLEVFVKYSWWALGLLVVFGLAGGWALAGFVLRPLGRITDAARRARDGALDHRIALPGRRDELTELADAFDAMLDRVQLTLEEERRFAANASHELRTPHAIIRTMVEVAQADPDGRDVDTVLARVAATNDRAIATTEALLDLARAGRGHGWDVEHVEVAEVVRQTLAESDAGGLAVESELAAAAVVGNRTLLEQLVSNLVRNAVVHNVPGGRIWITVNPSPFGGAELTVANTGRVVDPATTATLIEPFVRGAGRVRTETAGSGLGLAIVAAIVRAHGGRLDIAALTAGGLHVRVVLPA